VTNRAIKNLSMRLGLYPTLRKIYDNVIKPSKAREIRRATDLYSRFVGPGDLCFDLGANVGNTAEAFLRLKTRVVALEPHPECVEQLRARFGRNPDFRCVPKAVARDPGTARFHIAPTSQQSSLKPDWWQEHVTSIDVEVTTLDRLIDEFGVPKFCKIDVEGCEQEVFEGLSRRIPVLSFEYHAQEGEIGRTLECLKRLHGFGPFRVNVSPMETFRLLSDEWWDYEASLRFLSEELGRVPDYYYGDIFVKYD
jgi:FkbM family methyltransferase